MKNEKKGNSFKWIFFIGLVIIAAVTNPTKDEFKDYLTNQISEEVDESNIFSDLFGTAVVELIVENSTTKNDYVVCSVYEVEIDGEEHSFLGLFNNFIQLP